MLLPYYRRNNICSMRGSSSNFLLEKQLSNGLLAGYGPVARVTLLPLRWSMHRPVITQNGYYRQLVLDCLQPIAIKDISWLAPATPCTKRGKLSIKVNIPTTNSHYLENQYKAGRPSMFSPISRCFPSLPHPVQVPPSHTLTVLETRCLVSPPKSRR